MPTSKTIKEIEDLDEEDISWNSSQESLKDADLQEKQEVKF